MITRSGRPDDLGGPGPRAQDQREPMASVAAALEGLFAHSERPQSIEYALEVAATAGAFHRASVFEFHRHPITNEDCCSQRYEWAEEGVRRLGEHPERQNFCLRSEGFGRWADELNSGHLIAGPVAELLASEIPFLQAQGITSVLVVPLMGDHGAWGFVEFEDHQVERHFQPHERDAYRAFAAGIGLGVRAVSTTDWLVNRDRILRAVSENIAEGLFWKDQNGIYQGCNHAYARMLGLREPGDVIGLTDYSLPFDEDESAVLRECAQRVMHKDEPLTRVVSLTRVDGERGWVETRSLPLHDGKGQVVGVIGCWQEVTGRRALTEKLRGALTSDSLTHSAGVVAHDLNNVFMAITAHARLALDHLDESSEAAGELEQMLPSLARGKDLTKSLLPLAHNTTQAGGADLRELVPDVERYLRPLIRSSVRFSTDIRSETAPVDMDSGELEHVLLNLVVNASDAMPDGGELAVRVRNQAEEGTVALEVADTGIGMGADVRPYVFEPFFTTKEGSAGLGLTKCLELVRAAGGVMELADREGGGTLARVVLPRAVVEPDEDVHADEDARPVLDIHILLVDDDASVRTAVAGMLHHLGCEVVVASSAQEAQSRYRKSRDQAREFDLVMTDLVMPGEGGIELAEKLRREDPDLPILIMSGFSNQGEPVPDDVGFIQKPFEVSELARVLRGLQRA